MELAKWFWSFCQQDALVQKECYDRMYYTSQRLEDGRLITEISRKNTPGVFDDNTELVVLPTIFIRTETENPNSFSIDSSTDFVAVYLFNCSDMLALRLRARLTQYFGDGIAGISFVGSQSRWNFELQATENLLRFMVIRKQQCLEYLLLQIN